MKGALGQLNTALASGLLYHSTIGTRGSDTLTLTLNDKGHLGAGGALVTNKTLSIEFMGTEEPVQDYFTCRW